ncbi:uncharacterized protein LOC136091287 [Hydra vulgaris]|uniref:Uncharacterized protein LOC136091287 n=1 Tax=Hydra vulgaris TaxID=6087 RepID=A0ABM4DJM6_HYDVU
MDILFDLFNYSLKMPTHFENLNSFEDKFLNNLSEENINIFPETQMNLIDTPYFDPFELKIINDDCSFLVLHISIRSMQQNFEKLKEFLNIINYTFDVIALSETWHDFENSLELNSTFNLPSYKLISQTRGTGKKVGGLGLYISKKHDFKVKNILCFSNDNYESLFIEVVNKKFRNILIGCVYRPPSGKIKSFQTFIKNPIEKIKKEKKTLYVIGDMNLDSLTFSKSPKTKSFFDMLLKFDVLSAINKPTRVSKTSATAIDNILINNYLEMEFETGIFMTDVSDHFPIFIKVRNLKAMSDCEPKVINLKKRNLKTSNTNELSIRLKQETWSNVYRCHDTNEAFNNFLNIFLDCFNETCPQENIDIKTKAVANPWMDKSLIKCSKKKQKLYNKFKKNKNTENELLQ